ncbi:hypothetical protein CSKR_203185 [Clonorchis sinensis]|uniref:Uncharacterized protein n=1 Tax=Clonorchis sinensis TaxID=79923 RepID=A0A8T1M8C5_CLOSI|nr:hypothetical protein CSKR_203185 [Clonorchis sinensis]
MGTLDPSSPATDTPPDCDQSQQFLKPRQRAFEFLLTCKPTDLSVILTAGELFMVIALSAFVGAFFSWPELKCANSFRVMATHIGRTNQSER